MIGAMVIGKRKLMTLGCLLVFSAQQGEALVVGAPGIGNRFPPGTATSTQETSRDKDVAIRIRSTREEEIDQVASLLSTAIVDPPKNNEFNWKFSMDSLKTKVGVESLIRTRIQTMREGQRVSALISPDLAASDRLRLLWSNDTFRNKVERPPRSLRNHTFGGDTTLPWYPLILVGSNTKCSLHKTHYPERFSAFAKSPCCPFHPTRKNVRLNVRRPLSTWSHLPSIVVEELDRDC
jgi:hypothetical protein